MTLVESPPKAQHRHIFHIAQRAEHFGFLCVAACPQTYPYGFAAYFIGTMDVVGQNNRQYGYFHASASHRDGDISLRCSILDTGYKYDQFEFAVYRHLETFRDMAGEDTYQALLDCLERGNGGQYYYSSVGIVGKTAEYFHRCNWRNHALHSSVGRLYKYCLDHLAIYQFDASVIKINLTSHVRSYVRS